MYGNDDADIAEFEREICSPKLQNEELSSGRPALTQPVEKKAKQRETQYIDQNNY